MDGKWNKWWVLPLYLLMLPRILWLKALPPKPSPAAQYMKQQQQKALAERNKERNGKD